MKKGTAIKITLFFLAFFALNAIALAGDKEKNKSSKDSTGIIEIDSTNLDDEIDHDDTLVFDDWDRPDGDNIGNNRSNHPSNHNSGGNCGSVSNGMDASQYARIKSSGFVTCLGAGEKFQVYPNPATTALHIRCTRTSNHIRVIDILGNEVQQSPFTDVVNIENLPAGTYFIQLIYSDHTESRKFIKSI